MFAHLLGELRIIYLGGWFVGGWVCVCACERVQVLKGATITIRMPVAWQLFEKHQVFIILPKWRIASKLMNTKIARRGNCALGTAQSISSKKQTAHENTHRTWCLSTVNEQRAPPTSMVASNQEHKMSKQKTGLGQTHMQSANALW